MSKLLNLGPYQLSMLLSAPTTEYLALLFKLLSGDPHLNSIRNLTPEQGRCQSEHGQNK